MKKFVIAIAALMAFGAAVETVAVANNSATRVEIESTSTGRRYTCTGNNVILRTGPGKQYSQVRTEWGRVYLNKGDWCFSTGRAQNGYMPVTAGLEGYGDVYGWISTRYIR